MCKYMNSCSKNGKCQLEIGKCVCNDGFAGADCNEAIIDLPSTGQNFSQSNVVQGVNWLYFQLYYALPTNMQFVFSLSSSNPMDIYISMDPDVDVNEFSHDIEIKKQTKFTLRSGSIPGLTTFTAAVRINGANFKENLFVNSTVLSSFVATQKVTT